MAKYPGGHIENVKVVTRTGWTLWPQWHELVTLVMAYLPDCCHARDPTKSKYLSIQFREKYQDVKKLYWWPNMKAKSAPMFSKFLKPVLRSRPEHQETRIGLLPYPISQGHGNPSKSPELRGNAKNNSGRIPTSILKDRAVVSAASVEPEDKAH
ncbi:hypothetical protein Tco_0153360 [Tanacetum coccineum]